MKFQPKRFVVEVKRGTSRAAFASPDASTDRFSSAEAVLFGSAGRSGPKPDLFAAAQPGTANGASSGAPSGRILRSLVEPQPPVVEDPDPPVRRGRKPGSKNKPKLPADAAAQALEAQTAERPRRGRKPRSKNKPKPQVPTAFPAAASDAGRNGPSSLIAAMRSYGFADDGTVWTGADDPVAHAPSPPSAPLPTLPSTTTAAPEDREPRGGEPAPSRVRLRDRSSILKRYVLDIEPRPGQPGALRARRLARAS